jgi:hypothetical protein
MKTVQLLVVQTDIGNGASISKSPMILETNGEQFRFCIRIMDQMIGQTPKEEDDAVLVFYDKHLMDTLQLAYMICQQVRHISEDTPIALCCVHSQSEYGDPPSSLLEWILKEIDCISHFHISSKDKEALEKPLTYLINYLSSNEKPSNTASMPSAPTTESENVGALKKKIQSTLDRIVDRHSLIQNGIRRTEEIMDKNRM